MLKKGGTVSMGPSSTSFIRLLGALILSMSMLVFSQAYAGTSLLAGEAKASPSLLGPEGSFQVAQADPDEAFDPFSDYSEFDEASDEEADINFFRNGRFFTLGLLLGTRQFTGNMGSIYGQGAAYGLSITYFFDLRSALSLTYMTGDHSVNFTANNGHGGLNGDGYHGTVSISAISFDYKHYFNTQNITRGLADLNPYMLVGFGQYYRSYSIENFPGTAQDSTMGVNLGAGIEIPLMKRKSFLGLQGAYHSANYADENNQLVNSQKLDKTISGDDFDLLLILGMNF